MNTKKNMEADYPLAPSIEDQEILENFTNFTSTRAKCKKCKKTFAHTFLEDFTKHLKTSHDYDRIIDLEYRIIQKGPLWKYIKFQRDSESEERYECVLCEGEIVNLNEEFSHHTHAHEEDDYTSRGKSYEEWQVKYCKKRISTSKIKCGICEIDVVVKFDIHPLKDHIKNCDELKVLENRQKERIKRLWENFRRYMPTFVQCKVCTDEWECPLNATKLAHHLLGDHYHIGAQSYINLQKLHPDDLSYRCTICQQKVSETALLDHKCENENNSVDIFEGGIQSKYSVRMSDFLLKCAVCPKVYFILDEKKNGCEEPTCNKYENNYEEKCYAFEYDFACLCNGLCIRKRPKVWRHFDRESNSRAICKYCKPHRKTFKYVCIERTAFADHVERYHHDTFQFEIKKQSVKSWKYIKYFAGISACVLCHEVVNFDEFDRHLHDNDHHYFGLSTLQDYEEWLWKYGTIFYEKYEFRCDICREKIQIEYNFSEMMKHIEEIHLAPHLQRDISIDATADIQQQEVGIEGIVGPSSLAGTQQQEEGTENAGSSSSPATRQQDVDMSGTRAKQQKID